MTDTARDYSGSGTRVAFIIGKQGGLLDVGLLDNISLVLLNDGNVVDGNGSGNLLALRLLSTDGDRMAVTTRTNETFDAVRLRFGGVLQALTRYDLYSACVAPAIDTN